jgi:hypothetical protein
MDFSGSTEKGEFAVLMVDGAKMAGRNWVGVSIATYRRVSFWRAKIVTRQTAQAIACSLSAVVQEEVIATTFLW